MMWHGTSAAGTCWIGSHKRQDRKPSKAPYALTTSINLYFSSQTDRRIEAP